MGLHTHLFISMTGDFTEILGPQGMLADLFEGTAYDHDKETQLPDLNESQAHSAHERRF